MSLAIVFLDIDGVLDSTTRRGRLDKCKLERLARALKPVPGAAIVVSSQWRHTKELFDPLCKALQCFGMHVVGATPTQFKPWELKRPLEIVSWLEAYNGACARLETPPCRNFCVIDDRDLLAEEGGEHIKGRFVHTQLSLGLQDPDVQRIIDMLSLSSSSSADTADLPPIPGLVAEADGSNTDAGDEDLKVGDVTATPKFRFRLDRSHHGASTPFTCALLGPPPAYRGPTPKIIVDPDAPEELSGWRSLRFHVAVASRLMLRNKATQAAHAMRRASQSEAVQAEVSEASTPATDAAPAPRPIGEVALHEVLGRGGFGVVHRATLASGEVVALKVVDLRALAARDKTSEDELLREVRVMQQLEHPHILKLFGCEQREGKLTMALELCHGPELQDVLEKRGALDEADARAITAQLLSAVDYMHEKAVIHRDLKPGNVMLASRLDDLATSPLEGCQAKLLDFGLSRQLAPAGYNRRRSRKSAFRRMSSLGEGSEAKAARRSIKNQPPTLKHQVTAVGTRGYAPPEVTSGSPRGTGATDGKLSMSFEDAAMIDAFALGRMLRFMLTGCPAEKTMMEMYEAQAGPCGCGGGGKGPRLVEPRELSTGARELMERLGDRSRTRRMSIKEAMASPWVVAGPTGTPAQEELI